MSSEQHGRRSHRWVAVTAVLLMLGGAVVTVVALSAQRTPPQPPASAAIPYPAKPSSLAGAAGPSRAAAVPAAPGPGHPAGEARSVGPLLPASTPSRLQIPEIAVDSALLKLGLNADRTVQVPPLDKDSRAGWYRNSPTPGQLGPAVILGHVDSAEYGPGVFFRLGALRPGNLLSVTRDDNTVAVFRVDRVVSYPKDRFPTLEVYGNTDHAALRLITCGGTFDLSTHNYENNIVAYASMISSHRV
jgi:hypothetical protein